MSFIIKLLLLLPILSAIQPQDVNLVFYHRPVLDKQDAIEFRDDPNATIARVVVQEKEGIPHLYVIIQKYLIRELMMDTGNKLINLIFTQAPNEGWKSAFKELQGFESRIYLQIPFARGPGATPDTPVVKSFDEELPPKGFDFLIMAFAEDENEVAKYSEPMILEISDAFKTRVAIANQWLRLNAYHIRNVESFHVSSTFFEKVRDRVIIYQNYSREGVTREEVLQKMNGFDLSKIIWENVEPGEEDDELLDETNLGNGIEEVASIYVLFAILWISDFTF